LDDKQDKAEILQNGSWSHGGPTSPNVPASKSGQRRKKSKPGPAKSGWAGELGEPIESADLPKPPWVGLYGWSQHNDLPPDDRLAAETQFQAIWRKALTDAQFAKMPALLAKYGLDKMKSELAYALLALKLAQEFVPGFQVRDSLKKSGARNRWTDGELCEIEIAIARIEASEKCSPAAAVKKYYEKNKHGQSDIATFRKRRSEMKSKLDPRWRLLLEDAVLYTRFMEPSEISDPMKTSQLPESLAE
jgi:hypothetical protein